MQEEPPKKQYSAPSFDGKQFHNLDPGHHKFRSLLKWMFTRQKGSWPRWIDYDINPQIEDRVNDHVKITYINHATFLIQLAGVNILTDPIWSMHASPIQSNVMGWFYCKTQNQYPIFCW